LAIRVGGGPTRSAPPTPTTSSLADEMAPAVRGACRIVSVVGVEDEVAAAAKEILRLIEDSRCDPLEIGVVARTLDPYMPTLRRIFDDNRIPFACPVGEPLIHEPLVKTIIRFLRLPVEAFPRAFVIEVLTSPAFRVAELCPADANLRPNLWDWATRRLGIVRGNPEDGSLGDWLRLERAAKTGLAVPVDDDAEQPRPAIAAEQVALLFDLVARLHRALSALPGTAGWDAYTEEFRQLLPEYFHLPAWETGASDTHADRVQTAIKACLESVASLEQLSEAITLADWVEHVIRVLERARVPSAAAIATESRSWMRWTPAACRSAPSSCSGSMRRSSRAPSRRTRSCAMPTGLSWRAISASRSRASWRGSRKSACSSRSCSARPASGSSSAINAPTATAA